MLLNKKNIKYIVVKKSFIPDKYFLLYYLIDLIKLPK